MSSISAQRLSLPFQKMTEKWKNGEVFIDLYHLMDFPRGSDSKESAYNAGDTGLIPGSGRSLGECHRNPLQYSCLGNSMGYSPRGCRVGHDWATNSFTLTFVPLNGNIYLCNTRNIHIFAYWMLPQTPQEILLNIQNIITEIKYYLSEIKKKSELEKIIWLQVFQKKD